jgi:hypothetical protein
MTRYVIDARTLLHLIDEGRTPDARPWRHMNG